MTAHMPVNSSRPRAGSTGAACEEGSALLMVPGEARADVNLLRSRLPADSLLQLRSLARLLALLQPTLDERPQADHEEEEKNHP